MYTVQADIRAHTVVFGPAHSHRIAGDWPIFNLSARQAEQLASQLRHAAAALRWADAKAFAVGTGETERYHLTAPQDHGQALEALTLCDQAPEPIPDGRNTWTSIRPLEHVDANDPQLCPACAAKWKEMHP